MEAAPLQEEIWIQEKDSESLAKSAVDSPASRRAVRLRECYSAMPDKQLWWMLMMLHEALHWPLVNTSAAEDRQKCQNKVTPVTPQLPNGCRDGDISKDISPDNSFVTLASDSGATDGFPGLHHSLAQSKKEEMAGMYGIASGCYWNLH